MTDALFSVALERALRFATIAHQGQVRKATDVPYITHPVQVAWILQRVGFDDEALLQAALLHDVVEDCDVSLEEVARAFSPRVAALVAALSERKTDEAGQKRPWEDRKREHLAHLADASIEVRALALADKLHNLETIALDLADGGDVWGRFNAPRERLLWYYRAVVEACDTPEDRRLRSLAASCRQVLHRLEVPTP
jgi:(p)ppGpp synthase/HD superfamily hydrolase